ncbi:MAG: 50S ribosomal protein L31e [Candidatus Thermoplasmatota archaeon]|jgi:large subunit ribosomal protein L31e|nr:50S ribosomal protein L31e [Candidatus Thermoplasmatota archaeon]MCL5786305.1 50S ribosomal protein L31e [Candidatus Thermoplasmatota archaeon]
MVEGQVTEETFLNIPLRKAKLASRSRRADTAMQVIREHVSRHSSADLEDIWIDPKINEMIWARGRKKPSSSIRVRIVQLQDGTTEVILP